MFLTATSSTVKEFPYFHLTRGFFIFLTKFIIDSYYEPLQLRTATYDCF